MTTKHHIGFSLLLSSIILLCSLPLHAQSTITSEGVDIQLFRPAKDAYGLFTVESGDINPHLKTNVGLLFNWAFRPLSVVYTSSGSDTSSRVRAGEVVANRIDANLVASIGLFDYVELGFDIPMTLFQNGLTTEQVRIGVGDSDASLKAYAFGDVHVMPKARFLNLNQGLLAMALAVDVAIPTGNEKAFAGEAGVVVAPMLAVSTSTEAIRFAADIGYRYRTQHSEVMTLEVGDELFYRLGMGLTFGGIKKYYEIIGEVYGHTGTENLFGISSPVGAESQNPMEFVGGINHIRSFGTFGELLIGGGVGFGILPGYGSPVARAFAKVGYYMGEIEADQDMDGIPDDKDKCPDQLEDDDGFQDDDGCPDVDNDNDGVVDEDDSCPMVPEDKDGINDRDGCPEDDNDNDGITDQADACPDAAEDMDGFKDEDGCPDNDNDNDGILDADDKCPNDKEDVDNFEDEDGCPDKDNDKDGLEDFGDVCPNQAEDKDGFEDDDGCPDPDNDKDGIFDDVDKCPLDAEVINNFKDDDGCPDKGKQLVAVTKEKIEIRQKVKFKTGSSSIMKSSFNLLDQIASVLINHKEIVKIRIEGHTDSRGNKRRNLRLSKMRAKAVMNYLIRKGIAKERLESEGYGHKKPIASNRTRRGREQNRRVEFVIAEQKKVIEMIEVPGKDLKPGKAKDSTSKDEPQKMEMDIQF